MSKFSPTAPEILTAAGGAIVVGANNEQALLTYGVAALAFYGLRRWSVVDRWLEQYVEEHDLDDSVAAQVLRRIPVRDADEELPALDASEGERTARAAKPERFSGLRGWVSDITATDEDLAAEALAKTKRGERPTRKLSAEEPSKPAEKPTSWLRQGDSRPMQAKGVQPQRRADGQVSNQRQLILDAATELPDILVLDEMNPPESRTAFPVGVAHTGEELWFDLRPGKKHHANFVSLTGAPNAGKDTMFKAWFRTLCVRNTPEQVKFVFVDGKGPWYAPNLRTNAYMMFPFETFDGEVVPVMKQQLKKLDAEMKERYRIIVEENECEDLEEYQAESGDTSMPYIVLVVTDVLGDLTGDVENFLTKIVAKGRACGIRAWVSMQTSVGESSKWRSLMTAYISGPVQGPQSDQVVMGVEGKYLAFRPSLMETETKGVFCVRYGSREWLVRGAWQEKSDFKAWYRGLPTHKTMRRRQRPTEPIRMAYVAAGGDPVQPETREVKPVGAVMEPELLERLMAIAPETVSRRLGSVKGSAPEVQTPALDTSRQQDGLEVSSEVQTSAPSEVSRGANSLPGQQDGLEVSSAARRAELEARRLELTKALRDVPKDQIDPLRKAFTVYFRNSRRVTPAIVAGWGDDGGRHFSDRKQWVLWACERYDIDQELRKPS